MGIITVTTTADKGSGSLRTAIANAKAGDTIRFAKGLSDKKITLKSGQLTLDKNLIIDGGNAPGLTISGNNSSRVFQLERKKKATLKNLTVANGKTKGPGGGINTRHESDLTLVNVKVNNNTSELGGGIRVGHLAKATILNSSFNGNDGTLTNKHKGFSAGAIVHDESRGQLFIKGSSFSNNKGFNGGAIYGRATVSFVVEDSVFRNNLSKNGIGGGAIFTDGVRARGYSAPGNDGILIIRGSEFEGNQATGKGGALFLWGYEKEQVVLENSKIINNKVIPDAKGKAKGGAIWAKIGLNMRNVTVANNTATQQGGGLWLESKLPANIVNSTFSGNRVFDDAGGGMFLNTYSTPVNITNSTIANNRAGRANGALWFSKNHNITLKNSIVAFNTAERDRSKDQVGFQPKDGGGNLEFFTSPKAVRVFKNSVVADPRLGSLTSVGGALLHPLKSGSPAINAGIVKGAPKTDQRGVQRDKQIDIGSFEAGASSSKPPASKPPIADPSAPPAKGKELVAYLKLDDGKGKSAKDSSTRGLKNPGTLIADARWTKGVKQGAVSFDGKGDAIRLKNSKDINLGKHGQRTISLWFRANDTDAGNQKQVLYEEGAGVRGLNIYVDRNKLYMGGWNTPGNESSWSGTWLSTDKISANQWHHVALVLDGGDQVTQGAFRGYLDGQEFARGNGSQLWSHSGGIGVGSINGGTRFHNGKMPGSGHGLAGGVDELMVFNDALESNDIRALAL